MIHKPHCKPHESRLPAQSGGSPCAWTLHIAAMLGAEEMTSRPDCWDSEASACLTLNSCQTTSCASCQGTPSVQWKREKTQGVQENWGYSPKSNTVPPNVNLSSTGA